MGRGRQARAAKATATPVARNGRSAEDRVFNAVLDAVLDHRLPPGTKLKERELAETIAGRNPVCDFLYERFCTYSADHFAFGKELWDVAPIAWLIEERWAPSRLVPSPRLKGKWQTEGDHLYFEQASERHLMREVWFLRRNPIFRDLFTKLQAIPV